MTIEQVQEGYMRKMFLYQTVELKLQQHKTKLVFYEEIQKRIEGLLRLPLLVEILGKHAQHHYKQLKSKVLVKLKKAFKESSSITMSSADSSCQFFHRPLIQDSDFLLNLHNLRDKLTI